MAPKFKYNLDDILSVGPEEHVKLYKETQEAIYADSQGDMKSLMNDRDVIDVGRAGLLESLVH